jgi:hypothetical protein
MKLPDVTEQEFVIDFVFTSKETPMKISNALEEVKNCTFQINDTRDF